MSAATPITWTEHTADELHELARRCGNAKQALRARAIAMIMEGASRTEAARAQGMELQILRDWVLRYNVEGFDGLGEPKHFLEEQGPKAKPLDRRHGIQMGRGSIGPCSAAHPRCSLPSGLKGSTDSRAWNSNARGNGLRFELVTGGEHDVANHPKRQGGAHYDGDADAEGTVRLADEAVPKTVDHVKEGIEAADFAPQGR